VLLALTVAPPVTAFIAAAIASATLEWRCVPLLTLGVVVSIGMKIYATVAAARDAHGLSDRVPPHALRRSVAFGIVAVMLTVASRSLVVQAFKIPSAAMSPTLEIGDHIFVNKFVYGPRVRTLRTRSILWRLPGVREPQRGDIIVFVWPKDRSKDFIKRIVAVEGETIEVRRKEVYVDGVLREDPHAIHSHGYAAGDTFGPFTVPRGHVFVMGDNRDQSYDSRFWGPVSVADIEGEASVIYWSWTGGRVAWNRIGALD